MSRKQQLADLLQEHAQLVDSVHRLEEADNTSAAGAAAASTGDLAAQGQSVGVVAANN